MGLGLGLELGLGLGLWLGLGVQHTAEQGSRVTALRLHEQRAVDETDHGGGGAAVTGLGT